MTDPIKSLKLNKLLTYARKELQSKGVDNARLDALLLLAYCLDCDQLTLFKLSEELIENAQGSKFMELISRRGSGEPVSRIVGRRGFWDLDLEITPSVLDPRADSEILVETALELIPNSNRFLKIADFGTGSGSLLLAFLSERDNALGIGIDLSQDAVKQARRNALNNGLSGRSRFFVGKWGQALGDKFDLILCNPPYISRSQFTDLPIEVRNYDPPLALLGGDDGLSAYKEILVDLRRNLSKEGIILFECGYGQAQKVAELCRVEGFTPLLPRRDLRGVERCVPVCYGLD